jgi:hypothetical protein
MVGWWDSRMVGDDEDRGIWHHLVFTIDRSESEFRGVRPKKRDPPTFSPEPY